MPVINGRRRKQPMPPRVLFDTLCTPTSGQPREWLHLQPPEQTPVVLRASATDEVVWSSLWPDVREASIRFVIEQDGPGSRLTWAIELPDDLVDDAKRKHLRRRVDELINRDLRLAFGQ
jgi:hypothetical protein